MITLQLQTEVTRDCDDCVGITTA